MFSLFVMQFHVLPMCNSDIGEFVKTKVKISLSDLFLNEQCCVLYMN